MDLQAFLTAAAALLVAFVGGWFSRPKVAADAGKAMAEAATLDWSRFTAEIARLDEKIAERDEKIEHLEKEVEKLKSERAERDGDIAAKDKANKALRAHVARLEKRLAAIEALFQLHPIPDEMREALDRLDKD